MKNQFAVRTPCANCPFRNDNQAIPLQPGRREGIMEGLLSGEHETFPCHKTVYRKDNRNHDEDDNYRPVDVSVCAGAAAVARKFGRDLTIVQLATRLGMIPYDHYDEASSLTLEPDELAVDCEKARI